MVKPTGNNFTFSLTSDETVAETPETSTASDADE